MLDPWSSVLHLRSGECRPNGVPHFSLSLREVENFIPTLARQPPVTSCLTPTIVARTLRMSYDDADIVIMPGGAVLRPDGALWASLETNSAKNERRKGSR